jgi:hypothetical protein
VCIIHRVLFFVFFFLVESWHESHEKPQISKKCSSHKKRMVPVIGFIKKRTAGDLTSLATLLLCHYREVTDTLK